MNPAAPVRRIDIYFLTISKSSAWVGGPSGKPRQKTTSPIVLPLRQQPLFAPPEIGQRGRGGVLHATGEVLEPKCNARLLDGLPQHRLTAGREAFFQPVVPREEIINAGAAPVGIADGHRMGDRAGTRGPVVVGKSALIGVDAVAQSEVVQVS